MLNCALSSVELTKRNLLLHLSKVGVYLARDMGMRRDVSMLMSD
jgi:hypothetical protein